MLKHSQASSLICQIFFIAFFCTISATTSLAQPGWGSTASQELVISNGKISTLIPGKFKNVRKKTLRLHKPFIGCTDAIGQAYKDGIRILYYQTDVNWGSFNNAIKIWDIAFQIADDMGQYKFIESGFHRNEQKKSSLIYFLKIYVAGKQGNFYALLTFSEFEGKLLYGLCNIPETGNENGVNISNDILKNQYVSRN